MSQPGVARLDRDIEGPQTTLDPSETMVTFSFNDPLFREDPFPFYEVGRGLSPVFVPARDLWMVFGYNEVQAILRDHQTWSSARVPEPSEQVPPPSMLSSDPPRHTRLRGLVSQAFTPRMIEQLEPRIRLVAAELVDAMASCGRADAVAELAYPLPVIIIAEILGIPPADRDTFKQWSDEVVASLGSGLTGEAREAPAETIQAMRAYFTDLVAERRLRPRGDLISGLAAAESGGEHLGIDELLQMLILLLVAGNETTTNLIGNALIEFMAHPAELEKVREHPALLQGAIEEVLRYSSPVQATVRRATRPVEIGGKTIGEGQAVVTWIGAANRDPQVFEHPHVFNVTREPNRHMAFGFGIHFCLGAPLARLEARVALDVFLNRIQHFERTDSDPLPRVPTFIMRGVQSLPLALTPR